MKTSILVHPRIIAAIVVALRSCGFRNKDAMPDAIAEVQTRTLEWVHAQGRELPTDIDEAAKLCMTIAINWRIDERRKRKHRRKHDGGLCEEPDEVMLPEPDRDAEEPLDVQRKLEVFLQEIRDARMPANAEQIAVALAEGKTQPEIAQELGVSEAVVHRSVANLRKRFRGRLAALGLLTTLLLLAIALLIVPTQCVAQWDPAPASAHPSKQHAVGARTEAPVVGHDALDLEEQRELEAKPH